MVAAPFTCERDGGIFLIAGSIDERAQLADLVGRAAHGMLVLDLGGVTFINSLGVREWVRLQTAARLASIRVELHRVAEVLIHQLNIVPAARAAADVKSFYATYVCEHCGEEQLELLDVATHHAALAALQPPPVTCRACKRPAVLAAAPELYFSFVAGTSPLR